MGGSRDRQLVAIWAVGIVLRLVPVALTANVPIGLDDMFQYNELARNLLAGHGYVWYGDIPTAFRAPLYPAFLALVYAFAGTNIVAARLAQSLLGSLLPILSYLIAGRLFGSRRVSRMAGWLVALYPALWAYPFGLVTENLYIPILAGFVLLFLEVQARWGRGTTSAAVSTRRTLAGALALGVVFGLIILTRSVISLFALPAAWWMWRHWGGTPRIRGTAIAAFVLAIAAVTVPWSIRSSLLYGAPVFVESSLGVNLYIGYHPGSDGTFSAPIVKGLIDEVGASQRRDLSAEVDLDRVGTADALEFIRADPARIPYLVASKVSYLFRFDVRGAMYLYTNDFFGPLPVPVIAAVAALLIVPTGVLLLLASVGLVASRARPGGWGPAAGFVVVLIGYTVLVHAAIISEPRFLLPLVPMLAPFAGLGLVSVRGVFLEPRTAFVTAGLWLLLLANWAYEFWREADRWRVVLSAAGNLAHFDY